MKENVGGPPELAVLNVPMEFIVGLPVMTSETLRLVLALLICEKEAGRVGEPMHRAELAINAGVPYTLVENALLPLLEGKWIEEDEAGRYRIGPLLPGRCVTRGH